MRKTLTLEKLVPLDSYLRRFIATNKNAAKPASKAYVDGSGTAELLYNPSETGAGYTTFIDDILTTGDSGDALFELFPDSSTSANKSCFKYSPVFLSL